MEICANLGDHLDKIRKEKGLSITAFSERLGIARSSLQAILNGTGNPRSDTIELIASRLNLDYQTLLSAPTADNAPNLTDQQKRDLLLLLDRLSDSQEGRHE